MLKRLGWLAFVFCAGGYTVQKAAELKQMLGEMPSINLGLNVDRLGRVAGYGSLGLATIATVSLVPLVLAWVSAYCKAGEGRDHEAMHVSAGFTALMAGAATLLAGVYSMCPDKPVPEPPAAQEQAPAPRRAQQLTGGYSVPPDSVVEIKAGDSIYTYVPPGRSSNNGKLTVSKVEP